MQPGKTKLRTNNNSQLVDVLSENSRPEMVIGNRFLFETFNMHKIALVIMAGIALATHATRTASLQFIKILVDYLLNSLLTVFRHFEGQNIPYHITYSFGLIQPVLIWQS